MLINPFVYLRREFFSRPLMRKMQKIIPRLSETERIALEAGSVWWDGDLFTGKPDWNRLLNYPAAQLSVEEQMFIDGKIQRLCEHLDDWTITHEQHDLPEDIWHELRDIGVFGMIIPKAYGGLGFSALAHSNVVMKLASRSITAAVTVMVPNSLGPAKLLLHYGTKQQKDYYLPRLASGKEIPCFALTNPNAGSDAAAIPDRGIVEYGDYRGENHLGIRLNWQKRYITLGPVATIIGLAFQLYDPQEYLGKGVDLGITLALIPRDTRGVHIGKRHITMSIPFQNGPNEGKDVFIPISWVIGAEQGVGQGWQMLMESLSEGRSISLPALATGAVKTASRVTGAYAQIRHQFHRSIADFEGVSDVLARIAGLTYKNDAARCMTLSAIDQNEKPSVVSAIIKYHLTENYRQVANDAMDIQGGSGICLGRGNLIGRLYQAIPIAITVEGANILTRSLMIFGQGSVRSHPYILKELNALNEDFSAKSLADFDRAINGHVFSLVGNTIRSFWLGLSQARFSSAPKNSEVGQYFRQLSRLSCNFALLADIFIFSLGNQLKRKESLSARLGDIFSELYLLSACLKRFHDAGQPEADLVLLEWNMATGFHLIQQRTKALLRNHPNPWVSRILDFLIMPNRGDFKPPSDRLKHQAAKVLLHPSDARDRLTSGIYKSHNAKEKAGIIELALELYEQTVHLYKRLNEAEKTHIIHATFQQSLPLQALNSGLINASEFDQLMRMDKLTQEVIRVDEFADYGHADWHKQKHHPLSSVA